MILCVFLLLCLACSVTYAMCVAGDSTSNQFWSQLILRNALPDCCGVSNVSTSTYKHVNTYAQNIATFTVDNSSYAYFAFYSLPLLGEAVDFHHRTIGKFTCDTVILNYYHHFLTVHKHLGRKEMLPLITNAADFVKQRLSTNSLEWYLPTFPKTEEFSQHTQFIFEFSAIIATVFPTHSTPQSISGLVRFDPLVYRDNLHVNHSHIEMHHPDTFNVLGAHARRLFATHKE